MFETYVALVVLAIIVPFAILTQARRAYQRNCHRVRVEQYRNNARG